MGRVEILTPFPPSVNRIWRKNSRTTGGVYRSPQYLAWLKEAWAMLPRPVPKVRGPYRMAVQAGRPDKRRRDIDNIFKPLGDFMVGQGIVEDDSLAVSVSAEWADGITGCRVTIEPVEPTPVSAHKVRRAA